MIFLTRQAEFAASHFYHNPALSAEENRRLFGKCNPAHGHGHNYLLQVTVKGEVNPVTGMVLDLKELKEILEREVMDAMDHRFLNHEVPAFARAIPTTENIAIEIWRRLSPRITTGTLHQVRLYETEDLFVDYFGG
jgi:6-pyruvoyltetrahydropterin/6-carboxytetrahydropterin synthase